MSAFSKLIPDRRWLVVPPIVAGVLVVGALARSKKQLPRTESTEQAIPLEVVNVTARPFRPTAIGYGTARPKNIWTAIAEVGGRVIEIHPRLRSGNEVAEGDVLLRIDPADYELRVLQRQSDLSQAEAQLEQLVEGNRSDLAALELQQSLLEVRRSELNRLQALQGNSAASLTEADSSRAAFLQQSLSVNTLQRTIALTPSQIAAAKAAIELSRARLQEAKRDLERTTISSPMTGLLSDLDLQPQQYLAPGQSLFEVHDNQTIEVEAQFSLSQMSRLVTLANDQSDEDPPTASSTQVAANEISPQDVLRELSATVTVRSGDVAVEFKGKPVRATATIDEQTRTLGVIVEVDSTGLLDDRRAVALRSGAYCEVVLSRDSEFVGITIPRTAIRDDDVFLVDDSNRMFRRPIRIRGSVGTDLVVEGISQGERLVVNPPLDAADRVLVATASGAPGGPSDSPSADSTDSEPPVHSGASLQSGAPAQRAEATGR